MIALYLLAAHMVGDYVLQTRWQAVGKFAPPGMLDSAESFELRTSHVTSYCLPFIPIAVVYSRDYRYAGAFMVWLFLLHFITDRQRFHSTLGDWFAWTFNIGYVAPRQEPLPPNPWPPLPILIDQSLHIVQLAVLGGLFLS